MSTHRFLIFGRYIILVTTWWICFLGFVAACLLAYQFVTGRHSLQFPEPWESIAFFSVLVLHIGVTLSWASFCVFFLVLLRRRLRAGSIRQLAALFAVVVPFWGIRYYDRIVKQLTNTCPDIVSDP